MRCSRNRNRLRSTFGPCRPHLLGNPSWRRDLVFDARPDGRFAVIGSELGGVDASREEFEPDDCGEKAENYLFC
jgi:hypothetical protein